MDWICQLGTLLSSRARGPYIHPAEERPSVRRSRNRTARVDQGCVHATTGRLTRPDQHADDCWDAQNCFDVEEPA